MSFTSLPVGWSSRCGPSSSLECSRSTRSREGLLFTALAIWNGSSVSDPHSVKRLGRLAAYDVADRDRNEVEVTFDTYTERTFDALQFAQGKPAELATVAIAGGVAQEIPIAVFGLLTSEYVPSMQRSRNKELALHDGVIKAHYGIVFREPICDFFRD